jgi:hypothetical protein
MRSARLLLATAAASTVLTLTAAPGVQAGDWDHEDSSYSKEHDNGDKDKDKDESYGKEHDNGDKDKDKDDSYGKEKDNGDKDKDSYGKEKDDSYGKEKDDSYGKEHDKGDKYEPKGGMHTGGGALTLLNAEDGGKDHEEKDSYGKEKDSYGKEKDDSYGKEKDSYGKEKDDSYGKEHDKDSHGGYDKPHGGVHTGGGGLAEPGMTAGGLAVLALAGTGLYVVRRKKSAHGLA